MTRIWPLALAALAVNASPIDAVAATANVPFTGVVTATCVLTVGTPGILAPNPGFTGLSSTNGGGSPGTISALSTGTAFSVSAIAPTAFTAAPVNGDANVTFSATYSASGATNAGTTPGVTTTLLTSGLTNLTVNMDAVKSAGTFPAGAYAAEVLVRCE